MDCIYENRLGEAHTYKYEILIDCWQKIILLPLIFLYYELHNRPTVIAITRFIRAPNDNNGPQSNSETAACIFPSKIDSIAVWKLQMCLCRCQFRMSCFKKCTCDLWMLKSIHCTSNRMQLKRSYASYFSHLWLWRYGALLCQVSFQNSSII